jgi:hypothetical protein
MSRLELSSGEKYKGDNYEKKIEKAISNLAIR